MKPKRSLGKSLGMRCFASSTAALPKSFPSCVSHHQLRHAETQLGKEFGHAAVDDAKQRADVEDPVLVEKIAAAVGIDHHVHGRRAAVGLMQSDAEVARLRRFVQRKEIGIADLPVAFERPHENPTAAVLFSEL